MVQPDPRATAGERLYGTAWGSRATTPVVLLHGFGSDHTTWDTIKQRLSARRRVIVFDLPGHGKSVLWPKAGNAAVAAKAVLKSLDHMKVSRFHLAGHSMGGAVAGVIAMMAPDRLRSVTFLAPGGFGETIDIRLMHRYAHETDAAKLQIVLEGFYGFESRVPESIGRDLAGIRRDPDIREALATIYHAITDGRHQRLLPPDAVKSIGCAKSLVWGMQDRLLPPDHAGTFADAFETHLLPGIGHMLHEETPRRITRIMEQTIATGEKVSAA